MGSVMANSRNRTVARVDRLEAAFVRITDVLVTQHERTGGLRSEIVTLRESMTERLDLLAERLDLLAERLDRLIAITLRERTAGVERLVGIEERLARLERHAGF